MVSDSSTRHNKQERFCSDVSHVKVYRYKRKRIYNLWSWLGTRYKNVAVTLYKKNTRQLLQIYKCWSWCETCNCRHISNKQKCVQNYLELKQQYILTGRRQSKTHWHCITVNDCLNIIKLSLYFNSKWQCITCRH